MVSDDDRRADAKAAAQELRNARPKPGLSREEILELIKEGRRDVDGRREAGDSSKS